VLVPHTPVPAPGFHDDQLGTLSSLLSQYLGRENLLVDVAWLYTPMALPLVQPLQPACIVYDCMDELSAFKDAPRQLRQRESALMKSAALVLTGGPSLYEARREMHPQVVCLPSAVDAAHYAPAQLVADSAPAREAERLQGGLPRPRLGYFGVIDERLDTALIAHVADAHPEWSLVMAGPVVKISEQSLPRRPNLHWLGLQPYGRLPYLLAGWDVALMPFAMNESTRFISPTKTLEYMAGERPVVSTPVRDVISLYGSAVEVAHDADAFVAACEAVLAEDAAARCERSIAMLRLVATHSWQHSADRVHMLVAGELAKALVRMAESLEEGELAADTARAVSSLARPAAGLPIAATPG
jgi:UDP-galactopyranose mutase